MDCACIDTHLVRTGPEDLLDIIKGPEPATDRKREEELVRRPLYQVDDDPPLLFRCCDIEEDHFVRALVVVPPGKFHRVAGVPEPEKIRAFHHPAVLEVEAGNDPSREHHGYRIWACNPYLYFHTMILHKFAGDITEFLSDMGCLLIG